MSRSCMPLVRSLRPLPLRQHIFLRSVDFASSRAALRHYRPSTLLRDYPKEGVFQSNSPRSNPLTRATRTDAFPNTTSGFSPQAQDQPQLSVTANTAGGSVFQHPQYGQSSGSKGQRWRIFRGLAATVWITYVSWNSFIITLDYLYELAPLPAEPGSEEDQEVLLALREEFDSLPFVQDLRAQQEFDPITLTVRHAWDEWPAYKAFLDPTSPAASISRREHFLSTGPLKGSRGLTSQVVFMNRSNNGAMVFVNFGEGLCGWPGTIHGGAIATFVDESLARVAGRALDDKTCVTAHLKIDYNSPCKPGQWYCFVISSMADELNVAPKPNHRAATQGQVPQVAVDRKDEGPGKKSAKPRDGSEAGDIGEMNEVNSFSKIKKIAKKWVVGSLICVNEQGPTSQDLAPAPGKVAPHLHVLGQGLFVVPKGAELEQENLRIGNMQF